MKNVVARVTRCKIHQLFIGSYNFAWLLVGYSFVTRWLLVYALLQLFDAASYKLPN